VSEDPLNRLLKVDYCVIGSGLGGLSIAAELESAGASYLVFDKGRTPGGRAATRRFADSRFDHGLPLLTEAGPATGKLIADGVRLGVLESDGEAGEETGWFAPAGMSALGKNLAKGLNLQNRARVTTIESGPEGLTLTCDSDLGRLEVRVARSLFLTAPLPQSLDLLAPLEPGWELPDARPYEKCVVAMARIEADPGLNGPLVRELESGAGKLVLDYRKFPDVEPGVSLRFTPEISAELFAKEDPVIKGMVSRELEPLTGPLPEDRIQLMKWRYANGSGVISEPCLSATRGNVRIAVCGDAFCGGQATGVEASLRSCRAALDELI